MVFDGSVDGWRFSVRGDGVRIAVGRHDFGALLFFQSRGGDASDVDAPAARIMVISFSHHSGTAKKYKVENLYRQSFDADAPGRTVAGADFLLCQIEQTVSDPNTLNRYILTPTTFEHFTKCQFSLF